MSPHDLAEFVDWLQRLPQEQPALARGFAADQPIHVARAPGRLDVMGGIADYSGSLVLQMPIAKAACCAAQLSSTGQLEIITVDPVSQASRTASLPITWLHAEADKLRCQLAQSQEHAWATYLAGPVSVLVQRCRRETLGGMRLLLRSEVPEGKGVSSSAAVEVATMRAVAAALSETLSGEQIALWCQEAENHIAGAPCGVMDQMAATLGRADQLLALRCQPAEVVGYRRLPEHLAVWGIDSDVTHAVSGSGYSSVRAATFAGYALIAKAVGLPIESVELGRIRVRDSRWGGYVANVTPAEFEMYFRHHLPEHATGRELRAMLGGTCDPVTQLDPEITYAVARCTAHPIREHFRVRLFAQLLDGQDGQANDATDKETACLLGELMYQSHASYSACGLGSDGTDDLVERVRAAGPETGLFGAKITGGGSGGTVAVLGRRDAGAAVREIADAYARATGRRARVFAGSSPGAMATEVQVMLMRSHACREPHLPDRSGQASREQCGESGPRFP